MTASEGLIYANNTKSSKMGGRMVFSLRKLYKLKRIFLGLPRFKVQDSIRYRRWTRVYRNILDNYMDFRLDKQTEPFQMKKVLCCQMATKNKK